jgi:hypothetical protein
MKEEEEDWLSGLDSNQDKCLQRALCYRYTTGQKSRQKVAWIGPGANRKVGRDMELSRQTGSIRSNPHQS